MGYLLHSKPTNNCNELLASDGTAEELFYEIAILIESGQFDPREGPCNLYKKIGQIGMEYAGNAVTEVVLRWEDGHCFRYFVKKNKILQEG